MQAAVVTAQKVRRFALCESCFWSATVLYDREVQCSSCLGSVSLIPLAKDDEYRLKVLPSAGLELTFLRAVRK